MGTNIRKAVAADAPAWLDLLRSVLGEDYPDKQIFDPAWAAAQLQESDAETWVAEDNGLILATLSFLAPSFESNNPVANIGRHLNHPASYENGAAAALIAHAVDLAASRKQLLISRVLASDTTLQRLYDENGFFPVGFQPLKHCLDQHQSVVFYSRLGGLDISARLPISESLTQVAELAHFVLASLSITPPSTVRDGATGYPLQGDVELLEATADDFELWRLQAQAASPPFEISGAFNQGLGFLRTLSPESLGAVLALRDRTVTAGILCLTDPIDRSVRILDSFALDDSSVGPLLNELTKRTLQESGLYLELDVLATAPRLLKTAEQIGFVPVAYLPAVYSRAGTYSDVIKLVKLNASFTPDHSLTAPAARVAALIAQNFEDQKMGVAIINLLRGLPFFQGLGDGELRKVSRLFAQKLYRAGETIFRKGEYSYEACVVMRGQVHVLLNEGTQPIAQFGNGEIFGELAFLDGSTRTATAVAAETTIVLVIHRAEFTALAQREPHLGMVVLRNIALELAKRLRKTNQVLLPDR